MKRAGGAESGWAYVEEVPPVLAARLPGENPVPALVVVGVLALIRIRVRLVGTFPDACVVSIIQYNFGSSAHSRVGGGGMAVAGVACRL